MATIAITGVGGLIGRRLVAALDVHPDVTRIVGIDRRAPHGLSSAKLVFRDADVRDPRLTEALRGADVVIHLAFQLDPLHDVEAMRAINVDGTRAVVDAATAAGVARLVYLSSAMVYGAHPDNDVPLTEDRPLRGTPGYAYVEHVREVETWLAEVADEPGRPRLTVLRAAPVLGPGVQNVITRLFELPRFPVVRGHKPPWQFVHLDDLVTAIVHVLDRDLTGAYNVAAEGWLSFDEVTAVARMGTVEVPEEVAYSTAERLWSLGLGEHPPGLLLHLMHPWVVSAAKLQATGWQPARSNRDALAEMVEEHAPYVAVGGIRTTWRTVGRIAALGTAVVGWLGWVGTRRALAARARRRDEGTARDA